MSNGGSPLPLTNADSQLNIRIIFESNEPLAK